ncbi:DNA polymerase I [candidate division KSB1 bacterium]|nr:DNA polymerase I [candidate division KSB1 bacterium]
MAKKRLFLLDGSAIVYRAFFAFLQNPLTNSRGENTSAVFGFLLSLFKIQDDEHPDGLAIVFDTPEPTFRHHLFPEYKATREKMPDELAESLPRLREVLSALNIPILEKPGFEADDLIGTLAKRAERDGWNVFLVTGDKDFMQLVTDSVKMYVFAKSNQPAEIVDPVKVQEKTGVLPSQIIDYMSLTGDTSDNVPGVRGIGPKTASQLIQEFGNVETILNDPAAIKSASVRSKIEANVENAKISKELVTIHCDVQLDVELNELHPHEPDTNRCISLFRELEFNNFINRLSGNAEKKPAAYHIVDTPGKLTDFIKKLSQIDSFTLDLETTDIDPMKANIVGLSFSWKHAEAYYIPVAAEFSPKSGDLFSSEVKPQGLQVKDVLESLRPILSNEHQKKCGQNIKYDLLVLAQHGMPVTGVDFDTMVASYILNPSQRQHNLDALSLEHLGYEKIPTSDLIGKGKNQLNMAEIPVEKVAQYACEDADITQRLRGVFEPKLDEFNLRPLFDTVEVPLIEVLLQVERNGVCLDLPFLKKMSSDMQTEIDRIVEYIYELAGEQFNINSTKQLADVLFQKIGLPVIKRTKTGISTDVNVLEALARQHVLPQQLLEYRQLTKLKSTYVDAIPRLVHPKTGRVHTSYNQTVAATGRLSSTDPNLQNIPIRTEMGKQIRKAFIPQDKDHVLVDADYSQIELRIMAHLSHDETLLNAFRNNEDVHLRTASLVFKTPPEEVNSDLRRRAKEVNFGIMYGMGPFGLASRLDIPREEAEAFIADYFANYPNVKAYIDSTINEARQSGFVTTLLQRRRYLPEIQSTNRQVREFAERTAVNTPIQGSAADLIKVAMINIHRRLKQEKLRSMMIMQVHDELMFEAPKDELEQLQKLVKHEMEHAMELSVPIQVDVGVGMNWLEAH